MFGSLLRQKPADRAQVGQMSWPDYMRLWEQFGFGGVNYMVPAGALEKITALQAIRDPIVLSCMVIRAMTFSEVRFSFQRLGSGRAARDLFGTQDLQILEAPWPGGSTGELLARAEFDVSRYGNSYWWKSPEGLLVWQDPTKMKILTGDVEGPSGKKAGSRLLAYQTQDTVGQPEETFLPNELVHYRPVPDPEHPFRGLSWLSGLMPDISSDIDITDYKRGFLQNAAVPSLVVQFTGNMSQDAFNAFRDKMEASHTGPQSAFKTLYLGAGADVKTVGSNWSEMELATTQAHGEVRIAAAAGVYPAIVGIAEGLKGSALNTGNYAAVRRRFSDITMRPLWRSACAAFSTAVSTPSGSRLWYDDRDVMFLQADLGDAAKTRQADAATITALCNAGFDPDTVVEAVSTGDWSGLEHLGVLSVQLQPIGTLTGNGNGATPAPVGGDDGDGGDGDG